MVWLGAPQVVVPMPPQSPPKNVHGRTVGLLLQKHVPTSTLSSTLLS